MDKYEFKTREQADSVLRAHFELTFGIFRHDWAKVDKRPLATMAVKPAYKTLYDTDTGLFFDEYQELRIKDYAGISFLEYVNLPYPEFDEMREKCKKYVQKADERAEADRVKAAADELRLRHLTNNQGRNTPMA